jgi:hypothetical protein
MQTLGMMTFYRGIGKLSLSTNPRAREGMPARGPSSQSSNTVDSRWAFPTRKWVSVLSLPDAPLGLHWVELWQIIEGLSSHSQEPVATPQMRLKGLARLQTSKLQLLVRASTDSKEVCKPRLSLG